MTRGGSSSSDDAPTDERSGDRRRRRLGQRLGRYSLGALLGSGGAASVYLARLDGPHGFERVLALKIVHEHLLEDRDFVAMFLDEANLASQLQHPSIVHTYELCQDYEALYLAMEYLPGQPLSRVYRRALESNQPLPYSLVAWLGARAAEALAYAHSAQASDGEPLRPVHRDVSPDNLFISYDGQLKLLDFGIARAARRLAQTNLGQIKGKLRYMAPEYALGQEFDGALDIFALGATLYEAALGRPAFEGDEQAVVQRILLGEVPDPRQFRADFPPALWHVLQRMLAADAQVRLGPAASVGRELDAIAQLSFAQGRALLALTMERLFAEEKARDLDDLAELRSFRRSPEERTEHSHVLTRGGPTPKSNPFKMVGLAGLVLLAGSSWLAFARKPATAPSVAALTLSASPRQPPSAEVSSAVDIGVTVTPPGLAGVSIEIGGVVVPPADAHRLVVRGSLPLLVRVSAPGYQPLQTSVVPERDRTLVLALSPVPPAAPSVSKPTRTEHSAPVGQPAGVIKRYPF
ncbi:MAG TPA: serine/threonine-protein kinase [Polyangiaceae bacterium]